MSADDLCHRAAPVAGDVTGGLGRPGTARETAPGPAVAGLDAVADRVPPEYRDAYLEGFARARAVRETAA